MTTAMTAIAELLGAWKAVNQNALQPELRRGNRIRSVQASLAVEQNTLTLEQVTAVLEGKVVLGSPREVQEVRNAFAAYEAMGQWQPERVEHVLAAHGVMMAALVDDAGQWRRGGVGVMAGDKVIHMAPPASQVPRLMQDLLHWLATTDAHPLIASAAFHYEFEFIHPFSDGNGRMGRLWQSLILSRWQPVLAYLPVETVIKRRQQAYYDALAAADARAECSAFIEFLLKAIEDSLAEAIRLGSGSQTPGKTPGETREKIPDRILGLLRDAPSSTIAELASSLGKSESAVERAIRKLREAGRLRRIGPDKGGHWQVLDRKQGKEPR
jgi:Fic family protein